MHDKYKPHDSWKYHNLFLSLEQAARLAAESIEHLEREIHYSAVPRIVFLIEQNDSRLELLKPDLIETVMLAQSNFRFFLVEFLAAIGMVSDATALRELEAQIRESRDKKAE